MNTKSKISLSDKIKNNSSLFIDFVKNAVSASPKIQKNFLDVSAKLAETIQKVLKEDNLIIDLNYSGRDFWKKNKDKIACFIDGGIDKASLISAAPLSIRAGSYIVQPSAEKRNEREFFEETMTFLGDLYDPKNELYDLSDDDFEIDQMTNKKKDAGRIIFELAALSKHIMLQKKFSYAFLHGPIQATCHPFTVPGFPTFTKFAVKNLFPAYGNKKLDAEARHFVNVYLEGVRNIEKSNFPVFGIVETSSSAPYIKNLLYTCKEKGLVSEKDYKNTLLTIKKYRISDSNLFEIILNENQALKPLKIKKQIQGFGFTSDSPWERVMNSFPKVFISYIKTNNNQCPIRVESLKQPEDMVKDYEYILSTSKLLPNYGFPVGLNVVDRFAKIPNWMSKASRNYYAGHLLKQAVNNKDQNTISFAVKILSKKARSWINRPTRRGFKT